MSVPTRVLVQGRAVSEEVRKGVSARTNQPYSIRTVFVMSNTCLGFVTIPDTLDVKVGADYTLQCEVSVYGDDDQLRAVAVLEGPKG